ncbi:Uncharacterised protein [Escherichia coli]|uniref:Uncharacterized protein n=1 Tax=Escherichia coli TaxID=562 RepID=A0A376RCP6_ECOLX|nr:Uncharacterised protein [Escherichia coli]
MTVTALLCTFGERTGINQQANFNTIAGTLGVSALATVNRWKASPVAMLDQAGAHLPAHSQQWPSSANRPLKVEFLCPACEPLINYPGNKKTARCRSV